jgi:DNA-binding NtrC family response regulator
VNPNVVVIDDELLIRKSLTKVLRARGYRVETAATGSAGVELVERIRPQVAILDMRLPDTDGITVLRKVKAAAADTQVIVITAYGDVDSAGRGDEARRLGLRAQALRARRDHARGREGRPDVRPRDRARGLPPPALDRFLHEEILGESPALVELRELLGGSPPRARPPC